MLLEYDLEIKPTKLIKGQGLAKMMAQSNYDVLDINLLDDGLSSSTHSKRVEIYLDILASPWYKDIIYVLQHFQDPSDLSKTQARSVKLKYVKFFILNGYLYWEDLGEVLLNCLLENEVQIKIKNFHQGDCRGHLYWKTTAHKILRVGVMAHSFF